MLLLFSPFPPPLSTHAPWPWHDLYFIVICHRAANKWASQQPADKWLQGLSGERSSSFSLFPSCHSTVKFPFSLSHSCQFLFSFLSSLPFFFFHSFQILLFFLYLYYFLFFFFVLFFCFFLLYPFLTCFLHQFFSHLCFSFSILFFLLMNESGFILIGQSTIIINLFRNVWNISQ